MNLHSNRFEVEFDETLDSYVIRHPDDRDDVLPAVQIRRETLAAMSLQEAAQFIGSRLILLTPPLRDMFKDYLWTNDGMTPPKLGGGEAPTCG